MKVVITEVEMDSYKTVSYITLKSEFSVTWLEGLKEYEITPEMLEAIVAEEVVGWVDGTNRFGNIVKRTYMLIPN